MKSPKHSAQERIILAIDTSDKQEATQLISLAQNVGARFVKLGLELSSATSWQYCSQLASEHGLDWVADAKLSDIPNTVVKTVDNIANLQHPPFGITIHANCGYEAMSLAQERAETIKMLGVTVLTSLMSKDVQYIYGASPLIKVMELAKMAADAGIKGVVSSPQEIGYIKSNPETKSLFAMIPGTRSLNAKTQDQARISTPASAIQSGADLLVIGRQITQADNPQQAYTNLVHEIETGAA